MKHLDDDRLIALARGEGTEGERAHLGACPRCREAAGEWTRWLEGMASMERERLSDADRHNLRALYSALGPARQESLLARLVRPVLVPAAAVRGAATARLEEYEAGAYRLLLEVRPTGGGRFDLHLAVLAPEGETLEDARLVLRSPELPGLIARLDRQGEAHLAGLAPGRYEVSCWLPGGRVELPTVEVGGTDGP